MTLARGAPSDAPWYERTVRWLAIRVLGMRHGLPRSRVEPGIRYEVTVVVGDAGNVAIVESKINPGDRPAALRDYAIMALRQHALREEEESP